MSARESTVVRIAGFSDDHSSEMGPIYEDVPSVRMKPKQPERRDFRDAVVAVVCVLGLLAAFVLAAVWGWRW